MLELGGEDTRQRLLDAARNLFYKKGIKKTTLEMITAKAYVQPSAVAYYFGDKRGLVDEVINMMFKKNTAETDLITDDREIWQIVWIYLLWYKLVKDERLARVYMEYTNDTSMLSGGASYDRFHDFISDIRNTFAGTAEFFPGRGEPEYYYSLNNYLMVGMLNYIISNNSPDSWFLIARTDVKVKATVAGVDDSAAIREKCVKVESILSSYDMSEVETSF